MTRRLAALIGIAALIVLLVVVGNRFPTVLDLPRPGAAGPPLPRPATPFPDGTLELRPVDPATLEDLDRPGLAVGDSFTFAVSPNQRFLALLVAFDGLSARELRIVDVDRWEIRRTGTMAFPTDGTLTVDDRGRATWLQPGLGGYQVIEHAFAGGDPAAVLTLPESLVPLAVRQIDGELIVVAMTPQPQPYGGRLPGPATILSVDLDRRAITHRLDLDQVAGTGRARAITRVTATPGLAWDLERRLLFSVHASADRVTVVDLETFQTIDEGGFAAPTAVRAIHLTPTSGTDRTAALSADHALLVVATLRHESRSLPNGRWSITRAPGGLELIDGATLGRVARLDLPVDSVAVSPIVPVAVATGVRAESGPDGEFAIPSGIFVIDLAGRRVAAHRPTDVPVVLEHFSPDGRFAYVILEPDVLAVMSLETAEFVATRSARPGALIPELSLLATARPVIPSDP